MIFSGSDLLLGARYEFECTQAQIEDILKQEHGLNYALIASIISARSPTLEILESKELDAEGVEIKMEPDSFIIRGKLIDILCLEPIQARGLGAGLNS